MRVLFVDDEEHILRGLERLLSTLDGEWQCEFACSVALAMEYLGNAPFDVVVSDIGMPQQSGAALLGIIQKDRPEIVRIVLSGRGDQDTAISTVMTAHQFLAKPCEASELHTTLKRAEVLRNFISEPSLRALVAKLPSLPSVKSAYTELIRELDAPDVSMDRICKIIASDIAMSAKVLQLVNSAFFGLARQVADVRQATVYLGIEVLRAIVLSAQAFSMFPQGAGGASAEVLQSHSLAVSAAARLIAATSGLSGKAAEAATAAGMLHEIGQLVIATSAPTEGRRIRHSIAGGAHPWAAERAVLGTTHAEVGAFLLGIWGLPLSVVQAVADQAMPAFGSDSEPSLGLIIHVADACVSALAGERPGPEAFLSSLDPRLTEVPAGREYAERMWQLVAVTAVAA
jgi:HD-like signal output (HDOD) protein